LELVCARAPVTSTVSVEHAELEELPEQMVVVVVTAAAGRVVTAVEKEVEREFEVVVSTWN
jgi:hypothetical protein